MPIYFGTFHSTIYTLQAVEYSYYDAEKIENQDFILKHTFWVKIFFNLNININQ